MCRIMMYREDALKLVPSELCEEIANHCFKLIKDQIVREKRAKYIYRHGALCIAYLLRRRRYDDGYMCPKSEWACAIKTFLDYAIRGMESGQITIIGGFVSLPRVTQIIIEYIDRRGRDRIQLIDD